MNKIVVVTNKGSLSNHQILYINTLHNAYGVHSIFQVERKKNKVSRYKRYVQIINKHGFLKGVSVLANIPFMKMILSSKSKKRELLLENIIDRDNVDTIPKIDGGILNSEESVKILKEIHPDLLFQCGAGIIKRQTFQTARIGMINLHHGIVPSIRGMLSVEWAIRENRPDWIGISLHMINEGIDTGDLVGQARCLIKPDDDVASLYYKLDILGTKLLTDSLNFLFGNSKTIPAPKEVKSVYRSSFAIFDTLFFVLRKRSFFKKTGIMPEEYVIGEYLQQQ